MTYILMPKSITEVVYESKAKAFDDCRKLTIFGYKSSYAEKLAQEKDIPFVVLDEEDIDKDGTYENVNTASVVTDNNGYLLMGTGMTYDGADIFGEAVVVNLTNSISQTDSDCFADDDSVILARCGQITALKPGITTVTMRLRKTNELVMRTVRVIGGFDKALITLVVGESCPLHWTMNADLNVGTPYVVSSITHKPIESTSVSISETGDVSGIAATRSGSQMIRMDFDDGLYTLCTVSVSEPPQSISMNPSSAILGIGEKKTIKPSVRSWEEERGYTFTSSDTSVVQVDATTGEMIGIASGTAIITATAYNGAVGQCDVLVLRSGYTSTDVKYEIEHYLQYDYDWLIFLNQFFDGGGTSPEGVIASGVDISEITDGILQQAYATLVGGNGDVVLSNTVKAFWLADKIMTSLSPYKDAKSIEMMSKVKKALKSVSGNLSALEEAQDGILYMMEMWSDEEWDMYSDKTQAWIDFGKQYERSHALTGKDKVLLENLTLAKDALTTFKSVIEAISKYVEYQSVDSGEVRVYINHFRQSANPELLLVADILESFISDEAPLVILGYYGVIPSMKYATKSLVKVLEISEDIAETTMLYASTIVPVIKSVSIGKAVGTAINGVLFNIDDIQKNAYQAEYAIQSANAYRPVFERSFETFKRDPYNLEKYLDLVYSFKIFRELVAEEYKAFGAIGGAMNKSIAAQLDALIFDKTTAKDVKNYCDHWANYAKSTMQNDLVRYGWYILSYDASTALDAPVIGEDEE